MRIVVVLLGCAMVVASLSGAQEHPKPAAAASAVDSAPPSPITRFLEGPATPLTTYRAFRRLEAVTRGGKMRGSLDAWTWVDDSGVFHFEIVKESGSGTIRNRVLRAALEAEKASRTNGDAAKGALTEANYTFSLAREQADGLVRVVLQPKRQDKLLIKGSMLLTPDQGDLVRVEGSLVKRPSFWTRQVDVIRRYAQIGGVRVPVAMESTASVLMVGKSTFSMTYEYESINGRPTRDARIAAKYDDSAGRTRTRVTRPCHTDLGWTFRQSPPGAFSTSTCCCFFSTRSPLPSSGASTRSSSWTPA